MAKQNETKDSNYPGYEMIQGTVLVSKVPMSKVPLIEIEKAMIVVVNGVVVKNKYGATSKRVVSIDAWDMALHGHVVE